eukprot:TRINITY_DN4437_c0_g1_i1.p2 TRINITY_DN4437_c0_g1~~TRINITY_DN4437_c0_g1_i1.p2  ORF type:complete len:121 (-),score=13.15 TRINITY_DN4437_c0_g1_i1:637-999(-)
MSHARAVRGFRYVHALQFHDPAGLDDSAGVVVVVVVCVVVGVVCVVVEVVGVCVDVVCVVVGGICTSSSSSSQLSLTLVCCCCDGSAPCVSSARNEYTDPLSHRPAAPVGRVLLLCVLLL